MSDKKLTKWLVRDNEGEYITVYAESWKCGGDGLKFFVGEGIAAWFISWQHFREIDNSEPAENKCA